MNASSHEESPAAYGMDECTICHEGFKTITEKSFLCCAHYFHKDCIDQWLAGHDSCPICSTIAKENTFAADADFSDDDDDDDYPEDVHDAINFNPIVGYFQPMNNGQIGHLMYQAAYGVQQMGIHVGHNMQQWGQNMQYDAPQFEHNVQQLGQRIQYNAQQVGNNLHQVQQNMQQVHQNVQHVQQNVQQVHQNMQQVHQNVQHVQQNMQQVHQNVQQVQQRLQQLQQQFYP